MKTNALLIAVLLGLTACRAEGPPLPPIKLACDQKADSKTDSRTHSGGQPGRIDVSGAIVKNDLVLDSHIITKASVGFGDGPIDLEVEDVFLPFLSTDWNSYFLSMNSHAQKNTILAIGCEDERVTEYAKEHGLELATQKNLSNSLVVVSANTVMICGKVEQLSAGSLDFVADRLILDHVELLHEGRSSSHHLSFNANQLELIGESKITARGFDSKKPGSEWSPNFGFHIKNEIGPKSKGRVTLISIGASQVTN